MKKVMLIGLMLVMMVGICGCASGQRFVRMQYVPETGVYVNVYADKNNMEWAELILYEHQIPLKRYATLEEYVFQRNVLRTNWDNIDKWKALEKQWKQMKKGQ